MSENLIRHFSTQELEEELKRRKSGKEGKNPLSIVLLGPPGVGKATQCERIKREFRYCHIASGQLLRSHMARRTENGIKANKFHSKGQLVPDYVVNDIVREELRQPECKNGIVFEGFPKNIVQAEFLENMLSTMNKRLDYVLEFDIEMDELLNRLEGRRVHASSGRSYHIKNNPPKKEGLDDLTGEPLIQREDDRREIAKVKLDKFYDNLDHLIHHYSKKNIIRTINAMQPIDKVWEEVKSYLI